jgi:hypothetical protein
VLLAVMILLACSTPQATCEKPKNCPIGSLPAHSSYPVHFMVSEPMRHPPAQKSLPTSGCMPVPSQFERACSILANGTCPTGYRRAWQCGPSRGLPCRPICLLPNDADYLDRPIRGCRPYSYSGVEGCNTLLNGGCPTGYHGIFVEPPQTDSRGVRGRNMCVIDKK